MIQQLILSTYRQILYAWYSFIDRNHNHWVQLGNRRFLFINQLAEGGSGTVYQVIELDAPSHCNEWVIKRVNACDTDHRTAFHHEVQQHLSAKGQPRIMPLIASDLIGLNPNPNIESDPDMESGVPSFTVNTQGFMLMPFHRNGDLQQFVDSRFQQNQPLPLQLVLLILHSICEALLAFHLQDPPKVVGDLKPANLLICDDQESIVLTDLGSVTLANRQIQSRTQALALQDQYAITITAPYRSPECFSVPSNCTLDTRTDVWALGCVLFFMLTGHCAFDGTESSALSKVDFGPIQDSDAAIYVPLLKSILEIDMMDRPTVPEVVAILDQLRIP